jgi:hypothetical protein
VNQGFAKKPDAKASGFFVSCLHVGVPELSCIFLGCPFDCSTQMQNSPNDFSSGLDLF